MAEQNPLPLPVALTLPLAVSVQYWDNEIHKASANLEKAVLGAENTNIDSRKAAWDNAERALSLLLDVGGETSYQQVTPALKEFLDLCGESALLKIILKHDAEACREVKRRKGALQDVFWAVWRRQPLQAETEIASDEKEGSSVAPIMSAKDDAEAMELPERLKPESD